MRYTDTYRERSLGELFGELSQRTSLLVRQEVQLAKVEMTAKANKAGREIALIVAGAVLGNAALLTLMAFLVLALSQWMDAWVAALVVGVVMAILAGLLAWTGIQGLKRLDPAPAQTIETLREDKEWLSRQMN